MFVQMASCRDEAWNYINIRIFSIISEDFEGREWCGLIIEAGLRDVALSNILRTPSHQYVCQTNEYYFLNSQVIF